MKTRIEQVEPQFAQKLDSPLKNVLQELKYSIPENFSLRVSLLDASGRKKRSDASADNWSPETGRIEIRFEIPRSRHKEVTAESVSPVRSSPSSGGELSGSGATRAVQSNYVHPAESDLVQALVRALDHAEAKPGWNFVPLKKFRDEILLSEHVSMRTEVERQNVLRSAIEKRLVLVGKVPNPKAPEFPVTTIRLNRLLPQVQAILGTLNTPDSDFRPVEIRGEPLSATILRERR
jgi:hypothetical protein